MPISDGSRPRTDGVVAQRMGVVTFKRDGSELGIGDLDAARILLVDQQCAHLQRGGSGGADVVENRLVATERMAGQVLADLAEQAMVDRVPLGSPAGVVTDGDLEDVGVDEAGLEGILERTDAGCVAAA